MGQVEPIIKAVYCPELDALREAKDCAHCESKEGYAFAEGEGDKFGPICVLSKSGHRPVLFPTRP